MEWKTSSAATKVDSGRRHILRSLLFGSFLAAAVGSLLSINVQKGRLVLGKSRLVEVLQSFHALETSSQNLLIDVETAGARARWESALSGVDLALRDADVPESAMARFDALRSGWEVLRGRADDIRFRLAAAPVLPGADGPGRSLLERGGARLAPLIEGLREIPSSLDGLKADLAEVIRIVDDAHALRIRVLDVLMYLLVIAIAAVAVVQFRTAAVLRRAKEQLAAGRARLVQAEKMESIGRLAGGVAHDFNNLLTVITGNVEMALGEIPKESAAVGLLEDARGAAWSAADLTGRLLAFSRKRAVEPRALEIGETVHGMEAILRRLIGEDISLSVRVEPDPGRIFLDGGQVEQILVNLAANARDAMPRGGRLTVEVFRLPWAAGDAENASGPRLPWVCLRVRDTGSGIPPGVVDHIFEPFFTTKAPGKGTGLGLATVYNIVTLGGGTIEVESEPGRGTAFLIRFPSVAVGEEAAGGDAEVSGLPGGKETVFLVEDEETVRILLERQVGRLGYNVVSCSGGEDALRAVERWPGPVDLLVTDVVMPGMNGRVLAERVRRLRPAVRVLYLSGYGGEEDPSLLTKPFSQRDLALRIRRVLDQAVPA